MSGATQGGAGWAGQNWTIGLSVRLHDFVKTALIQQLVPPDATVCDLFCGSGTDTAKWAQVGIGCYVGVDSSASALEDAHEQWDHQGRPYLATFCEHDPCMTDLQIHLKDKGLPFDIVCCLGHLQDCFSCEDMVKHLLKNVAALLKPGGYFFGTTADSSTIWVKYQKAVEGALKSGSLRANGVLPRVRSDLYSISFEDDRFSSFGTKYQLQFGDDSLAAQNQLLVHFPSLIRLAKECDLEYIEIQNLFDFYEDFRNTFIDALRNSCGSLVDAKGRLPTQAHDVLSLYATFIFRKVGPPPVFVSKPEAQGDDDEHLVLDATKEYNEDPGYMRSADHQTSSHVSHDQHHPSSKSQMQEFPAHRQNTPALFTEKSKNHDENEIVGGASLKENFANHLAEIASEACFDQASRDPWRIAGQVLADNLTACSLSSMSHMSPSHELEQNPETKQNSDLMYLTAPGHPFVERCSTKTAHCTANRCPLKEEPKVTIDSNPFTSSLFAEDGPKTLTSHLSSWPIFPPRRHRSSRSSLQKLGHVCYTEHGTDLEQGQSTEMFEHSQNLGNEAMHNTGKQNEEAKFRTLGDCCEGKTSFGWPYDVQLSSRYSDYSRSNLQVQSQGEIFNEVSMSPKSSGSGLSKTLQPPQDDGRFMTHHDDSRGKATGARTMRVKRKQQLLP